jgi:hypothetical protein
MLWYGMPRSVPLTAIRRVRARHVTWPSCRPKAYSNACYQIDEIDSARARRTRCSRLAAKETLARTPAPHPLATQSATCRQLRACVGVRARCLAPQTFPSQIVSAMDGPAQV